MIWMQSSFKRGSYLPLYLQIFRFQKAHAIEMRRTVQETLVIGLFIAVEAIKNNNNKLITINLNYSAVL